MFSQRTIQNIAVPSAKGKAFPIQKRQANQDYGYHGDEVSLACDVRLRGICGGIAAHVETAVNGTEDRQG